MAKARRFGAGETLIYQGGDDNALFCLESGTVKVVKHSIGGHEIWLAELGAGTLFGEMSALTGTRRSSDVIAISDCAVQVLPAADFLKLMEAYPKFGLYIARMLAARIDRTSRQMFERLSLPATQRVYAELTRMGEQDADNSEVLTISPAQSVTQLSARWNISRESASRAMSTLQKQGLLKKTGDSWHVIQPDFEDADAG